MPPGPPYGPPPSGGSNTGLIIGLVAGGAFMIVVVLAVVLVAVRGGDPEPSPTVRTSTSGAPVAGAELKPNEYDGDPSWSLWDPLNDRSNDSAPLSAEEVFGSRDSSSVEDSRKNLYTVLGNGGRLDTDCAQAVWGEALRSALRSHGCTQAVRGVYTDSSRRVVGHVAVFNLRDVTSADQFIKDLDPATGKGFLVPLSGQPSPVERFGTGYSGADAGAYGHLVVVSWVGYTDGTNDSSSSLDAIAPRSAVERAAKNFLFSRVTRAR